MHRARRIAHHAGRAVAAAGFFVALSAISVSISYGLVAVTTLAQTQPPVISNVQSSNVTTNSADISWDTNVAADSHVDYGPTSRYGSTASNPSFVSHHVLSLTNLASGTLYRYVVSSADRTGSRAFSNEFTFTTDSPPPPPPPTTPPPPRTTLSISNIQVTNITDTSAVISWNTNLAADSTIQYGLSTSYASVESHSELVTTHSITLTGLFPSTFYHFQVASQDASGDAAASTDQTFMTTASASPPPRSPTTPPQNPEASPPPQTPEVSPPPSEPTQPSTSTPTPSNPAPSPAPSKTPTKSPTKVTPAPSPSVGTTPPIVSPVVVTSTPAAIEPTLPTSPEPTPVETVTPSDVLPTRISRVAAAWWSAAHDPVVQTIVTKIVTPSFAALSIINVATAFPFVNVLAYLQYLFTQPVLLIDRRKRKQWGVVYNSLTKEPVELAIVRLLDSATKRTVQSRVTDPFGRYSFLVAGGKFSVEVVKPQYAFPSSLLKPKATDVDFIDLYYGTALSVANASTIALNIPLDPALPSEPSSRVLLKRTLRTIQSLIALTSVGASIVSLIIAPNLTTALLTALQVVLYALFRRLSIKKKAKQWGVIKDAATKKPVGRAIVRIFDKKFNKLLETHVTDGSGTYGFLVRRNTYYVTIEASGYEKWTSKDIDLSNRDQAVVDMDVTLTPKKK